VNILPKLSGVYATASVCSAHFLSIIEFSVSIVGSLGSAQKVFLAPYKWNRLDACRTCSTHECHEVYSFIEIVRSIKGLYVIYAYHIIKLDEEGRAV